MGQLLEFQGKDHTSVTELGPGDIGAVPKLKDVLTGDVLADTDRDLAIDPVPLPAPVVSVAVEPTTKGDDEKMAQAFRRLAEEDPTLRPRPRRAHGRADRPGPLPDARRGHRRPRSAAASGSRS